MNHLHQPGAVPQKVPDTIPNPVVRPKQVPAEPQPVRREKEPEPV